MSNLSQNMINTLERREAVFGLPAGYERNSVTGKLLYTGKATPTPRRAITAKSPKANRPQGCPPCLPCTPNGRRMSLRKLKKSRKSRKVRKN